MMKSNSKRSQKRVWELYERVRRGHRWGASGSETGIHQTDRHRLPVAMCVSFDSLSFILFYFIFSLSPSSFSLVVCVVVRQEKENLLCALRLYLSLGWSPCLFDFWRASDSSTSQGMTSSCHFLTLNLYIFLLSFICCSTFSLFLLSYGYVHLYPWVRRKISRAAQWRQPENLEIASLGEGRCLNVNIVEGEKETTEEKKKNKWDCERE